MSSLLVGANLKNDILTGSSSNVFSYLQIIAGACLLALCAQIRIPLPFSLVPITLQTLSVLLIGCYLGNNKGAASVALYLIGAMSGLPILSGGRVDLLFFVSPVGGYLIGMIAQAYLAGLITSRFTYCKRMFLFTALAFVCLSQLIFGAMWLGMFIGFKAAVISGILPFIPGELFKVMIVVSLYQFKTGLNLR